MADAYRVLNVSPSASSQEIRSAYVELACQHHPCNSERKVINPSANHTQFRLVAEAYLLIGDDLHRELYDMIRSSTALNKPAYRPNLEGFNSQARLVTPIRRSRAFSELTIDLRVGLPPELRTLLVELDPIKLFNRVVNQIDEERRLQQQQKPTKPSTEKINSSASVRLSPSLTSINQFSSINTSSKSKYLSPLHCLLDESKHQRSRSPSKSNPTREDVISRQQRLLNIALKPGILRDDSKNQFKRPLSNLTESLRRDPTESYRTINSEFHADPMISRGHSRNSSYLSNGATNASTTGSAQPRNNKTRRVSFSNDVIETDELKQAREVVKSFKIEIARKSSSSIKPPPVSNSPHPTSELNSRNQTNKHGFANKTSPPSSYKKNPDNFSDSSLYRDPDRRLVNSYPQDLLVGAQPMGMGNEKGNPKNGYRSHLEYGDNKDKDHYGSFAAASAPTGYLSKYRDEYSERRNIDNPDPHSNYSSPDHKFNHPIRSTNRSPRRDGN